jgi:hypothetical protein
MTSEEIARKYIFGDHDALTNSQEVADMAKDINDLISLKCDNAYDVGFGNGRDNMKIELCEHDYKIDISEQWQDCKKCGIGHAI